MMGIIMWYHSASSSWTVSREISSCFTHPSWVLQCVSVLQLAVQLCPGNFSHLWCVDALHFTRTSNFQGDLWGIYSHWFDTHHHAFRARIPRSCGLHDVASSIHYVGLAWGEPPLRKPTLCVGVYLSFSLCSELACISVPISVSVRLTISHLTKK